MIRKKKIIFALAKALLVVLSWFPILKADSIDDLLKAKISNPCAPVATITSDYCARNIDLGNAARACTLNLNRLTALATDVLQSSFYEANSFGQSGVQNKGQTKASGNYSQVDAAMARLIAATQQGLMTLAYYKESLYVPIYIYPPPESAQDFQRNSCFWDNKTAIETSTSYFFTQLATLMKTKQMSALRYGQSQQQGSDMLSLNNSLVRARTTASEGDETGANRNRSDVSEQEKPKK